MFIGTLGVINYKKKKKKGSINSHINKGILLGCTGAFHSRQKACFGCQVLISSMALWSTHIYQVLLGMSSNMVVTWSYNMVPLLTAGLVGFGFLIFLKYPQFYLDMLKPDRRRPISTCCCTTFMIFHKSCSRHDVLNLVIRKKRLFTDRIFL